MNTWVIIKCQKYDDDNRFARRNEMRSKVHDVTYGNEGGDGGDR